MYDFYFINSINITFITLFLYVDFIIKPIKKYILQYLWAPTITIYYLSLKNNPYSITHHLKIKIAEDQNQDQKTEVHNINPCLIKM